MIICLYDNPSYPIIQDKEPIWADLPMGYFKVDERQFSNFMEKDHIKVDGTFIYCPHENSIRPVVGDHVLAAFAYKRERFLFNATLGYLLQWIEKPLAKQCHAHLGFSKKGLIKRW